MILKLPEVYAITGQTARIRDYWTNRVLKRLLKFIAKHM